jgi:hypothetical protein
MPSSGLSRKFRAFSSFKRPKQNGIEMFHTVVAHGTPPGHVQALLPDPVTLKLRSVKQEGDGAVLIVQRLKACLQVAQNASTRRVPSTVDISAPCRTCLGRDRQCKCGLRFGVFDALLHADHIYRGVTARRAEVWPPNNTAVRDASHDRLSSGR